MNGPNTDTRFSIDRTLLERLVGSEREFREEVLVSLAELKTSMRTMEASFNAHVSDDAKKFGEVNVKVEGSSGKLQWILGGVAVGAFLLTMAIGVARFFV